MKKLISLWLSGLFMSSSVVVMAQTYDEEALIFSRINPGGSARIQAMGGAQVALGGDYSAAYSNPAGLGFFNKSEFTFSLGNSFYNSSSSYLNQTTSDSKSNFHIPGFSVVLQLHSDEKNGKLVSGNFAFTFNRINNFNQSFSYSGINTNHSIINHFIDQSNGYGPAQFSDFTLQRLGYENYLLGPLSDNTGNAADTTQYFTRAVTIPNTQQEHVKTTGAQNQLNLAYGLNINDVFFVGATLGIVTLKYSSAKVYTENFSNASPLANFELDENLKVTGLGINGTIGIIAKPKDFIQFGLSATTPTGYSLTEDYSAALSSNWRNYSYNVASSAKSVTLNQVSSTISYSAPFLYGLRTPWRLKAGATIFIKKHGLITAEIEKVNYQKSNFSSNADTPYDFSQANSAVTLNYRNVFNIRVGGEFRYKSYRLRAGYNYLPDPYSKIQNNVDNAITGYSTGIGYRTAKYFVDLGFNLTQWNSTYNPYTLISDSPLVTIKHSNPTGLLTVGFLF